MKGVFLFRSLAFVGVASLFFLQGVGEARAQAKPSQESPEDLRQGDLPETVRQAMRAGNAAFAKGDYRGAKEFYGEALKVLPDNRLLLVNAGMTSFYLGEAEDAEKCLWRAIQQKIDLPPAWQVLGLIHLDARRYEKAMAAFSQVVDYEPRNAKARNYLGVAVGQMGWYDGAEASLRKAVELDPNYADAHYNLAFFALQRKEPAVELARRHYLKAVDLGATRDEEIEKQLKKNKEAEMPQKGGKKDK